MFYNKLFGTAIERFGFSMMVNEIKDSLGINMDRQFNEKHIMSNNYLNIYIITLYTYIYIMLTIACSALLLQFLLLKLTHCHSKTI